MKKAVKKTNKQIKNNKKEVSEVSELRKLTYIFGSIVLVFLVFYGIAYLKMNHKKEEEEIVSFIQYEKILVNNIVNQNQKDYYALVYNDEEDYAGYYIYYIQKYSKNENALFTYLIDMNDSFNHSYKSDISNLNVTDISQIRFKEDTLLKISDGKIIETYEGMETIANYLKQL